MGRIARLECLADIFARIMNIHFRTDHGGYVILIQPHHLGDIAGKSERVGAPGKLVELARLYEGDMPLGDTCLRRDLLDGQPLLFAREAQLRPGTARPGGFIGHFDLFAHGFLCDAFPGQDDE